MDYSSLIKEIKTRKFKPVYLLHGEEPYYIDLISKTIEEEALEDHERDFNQTIVYGKDADVIALIGEARNFPMMSERRLVIVREAQDIKDKDLELLETYFLDVNPSTVLVLAYKYKKLDSRKKLYKEIARNGEVFLSEKVRDYKLVDWINTYLRTTSYSITPKAATLLVDFLGNDLSKITNELDKLTILIQAGTTINEVHIEENIGISKDFNITELVSAIQVGDVPKAFRIVNYFAHNPKSGPLVVVVAQSFNLFVKLMRIHFLENRSPEAIASEIRVHPFFVKDYINASKLYPPKRIAKNISVLHEYDLKSKGVGSTGDVTDGELMKEMVFKLLH
ncbi:MAG: DNA polymerase III subunit delta [Bacteroidota bacterium]